MIEIKDKKNGAILTYLEKLIPYKPWELYGDIPLAFYLEQTENIVIKTNPPTRAISIFVIEEDKLNQEDTYVWLKEEYHIDIVEDVYEFFNQDRQGLDIYKLKKQIGSPQLEETINKIINLDILRVCWSGSVFMLTEKTKQNIKDRKMKLAINNQSWKQITREIQSILYFEKLANFKLEQNNNLWLYIFNLIPYSTFLMSILTWNTRMKQTGTKNVPMFLLTFCIGDKRCTKKPKLTIRDMRVVFRHVDSKHLWRIQWSELTVIEKLNANFGVFSQQKQYDNIDYLMLHETKLYLKDFFDAFTSFEQKDKFDLDQKFPATCYDIIQTDEDTNINNHLTLKMDEDNNIRDEDYIVVYLKINNKKMKAACTSKQQLERSATLKYYQCTIQDDSSIDVDYLVDDTYVLLDNVYVRLDIFEFSLYITQKNLSFILESKSKYFYVQETPQFLNFTIEKRTAKKNSGRHYGGHHCQEGTSKQISVIFAMDANSVSKAQTMLQT